MLFLTAQLTQQELLGIVSCLSVGAAALTIIGVALWVCWK